MLADIFLPDQPREELDAAIRQQRDSATAATATALLELTYRMDVSTVISDVTADLLVLHRVGDRAIPIDAGRKLASVLAGVPFIALDGRAHPPWSGDRQSILEPAVEFLGGGHRIKEKYRLPSLMKRLVALILLAEVWFCQRARYPSLCWNTASCVYFVENADRVVSREELLEHIWNTSFSGSNKVDVLIRALRKKLGAYAPCIETIPGHGYLFAGWESNPQH